MHAEGKLELPLSGGGILFRIVGERVGWAPTASMCRCPTILRAPACRAPTILWHVGGGGRNVSIMGGIERGGMCRLGGVHLDQ